MDGKKRQSHPSDGLWQELEIDELGVLSPTQKRRTSRWEVGYLAAAIKAVADARVGDDYVSFLTGSYTTGLYRSQPMVFCGLFPSMPTSLKICGMPSKLKLNDGAAL